MTLLHNEVSCLDPDKKRLSFRTRSQLMSSLDFAQSGIESVYCRHLFAQVTDALVCPVGLVERVLSAYNDAATPSFRQLDVSMLGQSNAGKLASKMKGVALTLAAQFGEIFIQRVEKEFFDQVHVQAHALQLAHGFPSRVVMSWFGFQIPCSYEGTSTTCDGDVENFLGEVALGELVQSVISASAKSTERDAYIDFFITAANTAYCEAHLSEFFLACVLSVLAEYIPKKGGIKEKVARMSVDPHISKVVDYWTMITLKMVQQLPGVSSTYRTNVERRLLSLLNDKWSHWETVLMVDKKLEDTIFSPDEEAKCLIFPKFRLADMLAVESCLHQFSFVTEDIHQVLSSLLRQVVGQRICAVHTVDAIHKALLHSDVTGDISDELLNQLMMNLFVGLVQALVPHEFVSAVLVLHQARILARQSQSREKRYLIVPYHMRKKRQDNLN